MKSKFLFEKNRMYFVEILFSQDSLVFQIDSVLMKSSSISKKIVLNFFSNKETDIFKSQISFNKKSNFIIFDFYLDLNTKINIWNELTKNYLNILSNFDCFKQPDTFLFYSYFLKEFKKYSNVKDQNLADTESITNFVKEIITNGEHNIFPAVKKY